ncbi:MAG TPA: GreA/GreB family elongation factor [Candidatus Saccharimonadales bacterium]|jgi:transcription elongation GreA/GreB family factor|nr:GreA/GreB family elongation factor [Candidatus Saccharimonadales bacterium]
METTNMIYLSSRGMKELKKQVSSLEKDRTTTLTSLRELDKTESHDERLARVEKLAALEVIDSELAMKKSSLAMAKPLPRKRDALKVALGSIVELLDTNGRVIKYTLVDSLEANPSDGRISIKSPLGQNLVGKQIQDVVEWTAGIGRRQLELVSIH